MTRFPAVTAACAVALAGYTASMVGTSVASTGTGGGALASHPAGAPVCRQATYGPAGSRRAQEKVTAVAARVRKAAARQDRNGLSTMWIDTGSRTVNVYWVGAVPAEMAALNDVRPGGVKVDFHRARFTEKQLHAAQDRVSAGWDSVSGAGLASVGRCDDGSGLRVEIFDPATGAALPSVPDSVSVRVRELAGSVPVLLVPGAVARAVPGTVKVDPRGQATSLR